LGASEFAADILFERLRCIRAQPGQSFELLIAAGDALPFADRGGRWADGEALAREYYDLLVSMGGGHGVMLFDAELFLARFVSLQGRSAEADELFAALLDREQEVTTESRTYARLHLYVASHLRRNEEYAAAEAHLKNAERALADVRLGTLFANPDDVLAECVALYQAWEKPAEEAHYAALLEESLQMSVGLHE
jgi:hypothetical protein